MKTITICLLVTMAAARAGAECSVEALEGFDRTARDLEEMRHAPAYATPSGRASLEAIASWVAEHRPAMEACRARRAEDADRAAWNLEQAAKRRAAELEDKAEEKRRRERLNLEHASQADRRVVLSALACDQAFTRDAAAAQHRALARMGWETGIDRPARRVSAAGAAARSSFELRAIKARARAYRLELLGCRARPVARLLQCVEDDTDECGELAEIYSSAASEIEGEAYGKLMEATTDHEEKRR